MFVLYEKLDFSGFVKLSLYFLKILAIPFITLASQFASIVLRVVSSFKCYHFKVVFSVHYCYTVLRSNQISPAELLLTLNSINPSIQFTMEYSKDQIPFLDILIKRNENGIWMDLYHKPTDTQRCLPFTFSHPNHCKRNVPFCLAQRICTIAENNTEKLKSLENLITHLSKYH